MFPICRFCNDRGCVACPGEAEKRLPKPLFVVTSPEEIRLLKPAIGYPEMQERRSRIEGEMPGASTDEVMSRFMAETIEKIVEAARIQRENN